MTVCQYLLLEVPLSDLTVLNDYGLQGWRVVAVVGGGPPMEEFLVLIEKVSIFDETKPKPRRAA